MDEKYVTHETDEYRINNVSGKSEGTKPLEGD
jgi:hypothetical protein